MLDYLTQHGQAEAKYLSELCAILTEETGIKCARDNMCSGKPRIITRVHTDRLSKRAKIKLADWKSLVKHSHDLEEWGATTM